MRFVLSLLISALSAFAQTQPTPPPAPPAGSISGVVKDADSGAPIRDAEVGLRAGSKSIAATTGADGRYKLSDVPPGEYRVAASTAHQGQMGFGSSRMRQVIVGPGQEVTGFDFPLTVFAKIAGKVVDENKEPIPDMSVIAIAREYRLGALRYVFTSGVGRTNDRGEYAIDRIQPGRPILLMAMRRDLKLNAISDAPADPKLRKRASVPTFYPDSTAPQGGQLVALRSGEVRPGMDFRLHRSPSYCLEGVLLASGGPAALAFWIEDRQPASGRSGDGGTYMAMPSGKTAPDGKFRICDLHPGDYRLTAYTDQSSRDVLPPFFGATILTVTDQDVPDLRIQASPKTPLAVEVAWDGAAPAEPVNAKVRLFLQPAYRAFINGEARGPAPSAAIPGEISIPEMVVDDYELEVLGVPSSLYVKDIAYGGNSILHKLFRPGPQKLRVTIGQDGGYIAAQVKDKDGAPVGDTNITILPESSAPDPEYAALILSGRTNQLGRYRSGPLAPGKYYVLASAVANDNTPEMVANLRRARTKAKEVEVKPGATVQAELELIAVD